MLARTVPIGSEPLRRAPILCNILATLDRKHIRFNILITDVRSITPFVKGWSIRPEALLEGQGRKTLRGCVFSELPKVSDICRERGLPRSPRPRPSRRSSRPYRCDLVRVRHGTADLGRRLVLAETFVDNLAEQIVLGPSQILDLAEVQEVCRKVKKLLEQSV